LICSQPISGRDNTKVETQHSSSHSDGNTHVVRSLSDDYVYEFLTEEELKRQREIHKRIAQDGIVIIRKT
jgi:hypothetical protein